MSYAKRFLAASLATSDLSAFLQYGNAKHLFEYDPVSQPAFDFVMEYIETAGALPTIELVEEETEINFTAETAAPEWLFGKAFETHVQRAMKLMIEEAKKEFNENPLIAMKNISDRMSELEGQRLQPNVSNFKNAIDDLWPYLLNKWNPSEAVIGFGWPYFDQQSGGLEAGDMVGIVGQPGRGKAQPLTEPVLLADGTWKPMGDIQVGDRVASVDGKPSKVTAIHPQGMRPTYRLTFADGRQVEADAEHLWEVSCSRWTQQTQVLTTVELIEKRKVANTRGRIGVPLVSGDFGHNEPLPIDPYALGALLGYGCFKSKDVRYSTADPEMVVWLDELLAPLGVKSKWLKNVDYTLQTAGKGHPSKLRRELIALDLWGKYAHEKAIPEQYMSANKAARLALLQGLMDTDGTAGNDGSVQFCSTSWELARQVQKLVRSLGGLCSFGVKDTTHRQAYILGIRMQCPKDSFRLERKKSRLGETQQKGRTLKLMIHTIQKLEDQDCQCISVSHPRHLYVTSGYTVTHNTWFLLWIALNIWRTLKQPIVFVSMEMSKEQILSRLAAMYTEVGMDFFKFGQSPNLFIKAKQGTKQQVKDMLKALKESDLPDFIVVDGNIASTVEDCVAVCRQYKAAACLIDGAYALDNDKAKGIYDAVTANVKLLKRKLAAPLKIPCICTWQFENLKKLKKGDMPTMDNIGYSRAIQEYSSILLGLFEEEDMANVENLFQRTIYIMKGRSGEVGRFKVRWDFQKMNFGEVVKAAKIEMFN